MFHSELVTTESSKYTYFVQSETCLATQIVVHLLMTLGKTQVCKYP